jgi:iron(III) transport system substrate-binding protein
MNVARAMLAAVGLGLVLALGLSFLAPPASAQSGDWKQKWDRTVAAAKAEGELVLSIPSGSVWRGELARFETAYPDIKLKMTAFSGRDFWPRFVKEREVGQNLWDLRAGGTDHVAYRLKNEGQFEPVRDFLILPEVANDDNWYGGIDGMFLDKEKRFVLTYVAVETNPALYNKKFVGDAGLTATDLVDPKWRGKIAMADPSIGSSLAGMSVLYKRLGPDFIRKLVIDQKPVITRVPRQQLDWLIAGRYPIAWGLPSAATVEYEKRGGDISFLEDVRGGLQWSNGVGGIQMPTKAPHPNAAKVFINWLLTKDTQTHLMKGVQLNSRRKDVPPGAPELILDHTRMNDYLNGQSEEIDPYQYKVLELVREGGR